MLPFWVEKVNIEPRKTI